jgi:hypothetical protein
MGPPLTAGVAGRRRGGGLRVRIRGGHVDVILLAHFRGLVWRGLIISLVGARVERGDGSTETIEDLGDLPATQKSRYSDYPANRKTEIILGMSRRKRKAHPNSISIKNKTAMRDSPDPVRCWEENATSSEGL